MKRDPGLIRQLLLLAEQTPAEELPLNDVVVAGYSERVVVEHVILLSESGYLSAGWYGGLGRERDPFVIRITMKGYDFLDSVRSDTVFNKTKEEIEKGVGAASLEIWKEVATQIVRGILLGGGV